MKGLKKIIAISIKLFLVMVIVTGIIYPVTVTALGQLFFNDKVNGSIVEKNGVKVGSEFIGQNFTDPKYFFGRPSETGEYPYNTLSSKGSNKAIESKEFEILVNKRIEKLKEFDKDNKKKIPIDLITASGSGLDPEISVDGALYQVERVAKYRNLPKETVEKLIKENTEKSILGLFGVDRVNVLKLNLALDEIKK